MVGSKGLQHGIPFLESVGLSYSVISFVHDTHRMYLDILLARHTASQVLRSTPLTPPHDPHGPFTPQTIPSSPSSCVQLPGDVSPISFFSSQVETTFEARHQCAQKKIYTVYPFWGQCANTAYCSTYFHHHSEVTCDDQLHGL